MEKIAIDKSFLEKIARQIKMRRDMDAKMAEAQEIVKAETEKTAASILTAKLANDKTRLLTNLSTHEGTLKLLNKLAEWAPKRNVAQQTQKLGGPAEKVAAVKDSAEEVFASRVLGR